MPRCSARFARPLATLPQHVTYPMYASLALRFLVKLRLSAMSHVGCVKLPDVAGPLAGQARVVWTLCVFCVRTAWARGCCSAMYVRHSDCTHSLMRQEVGSAGNGTSSWQFHSRLSLSSFLPKHRSEHVLSRVCSVNGGTKL